MHGLPPDCSVIVLSALFVVTVCGLVLSCAVPRRGSRQVVCSPCVRTPLEVVFLFDMPARRFSWLLTARSCLLGLSWSQDVFPRPHVSKSTHSQDPGQHILPFRM